MLQQLEARFHSDVERGFTTFGPHREDFAVLFDGHPVEDVASRGETRTFILGMKIIEMQLIEERREEVPLVLLDDVFSELDGKRRHFLTDYLGQRQVFITTTDADVVVRDFAACHIIPMT
jgi:DNA replication and repair protein RecF